MATLADYPQPEHPERVGIPRYQDVHEDRRSLRALNRQLELDLADAEKFLRDWRKTRDKKLSMGDKIFRRSKWKALNVEEVEVLHALGTRYNRNHLTGDHYLSRFGWDDGDGE